MSVELMERPAPEAPAAVEIHRVEIAASHTTGGKTMFRCWHLGAELLVGSDPEHAACRALLAMGRAGKLVVRWKGAAHDAMVFDIERGAGRSVSDGSSSGLRLARFTEFARWPSGDGI